MDGINIGQGVSLSAHLKYFKLMAEGQVSDWSAIFTLGNRDGPFFAKRQRPYRVLTSISQRHPNPRYMRCMPFGIVGPHAYTFVTILISFYSCSDQSER